MTFHTADYNSDSSSGSDMPPLTPRVNHHDGDDSSSMSSSSSDDTPYRRPPNNNRAAPRGGGYSDSNDDDDDDDDDDSDGSDVSSDVPDLLDNPNNDSDDSSDEEDYDDDDLDSDDEEDGMPMPPLANRGHSQPGHVGLDSESSSDEKEQDDNQADTDDDEVQANGSKTAASSSNKKSSPNRSANKKKKNKKQPPKPSDDDESDDSEPPPLQERRTGKKGKGGKKKKKKPRQRARRGSKYSSSDSSDSDYSDDSSSSSDDGMPELHPRAAEKPKKPEPPKKTPEELRKEALEAEADALTESQLRLWVIQHSRANGDKKLPETVRKMMKLNKNLLKNEFIFRKYEDEQANKKNGSKRTIPPSNSLRSMPALMPVRDPRIYGAWILKPKPNFQSGRGKQNQRQEEFELCYMYRTGSSTIESSSHAKETQVSATPSFGPGSFLVPTIRAHHRSVWVCRPTTLPPPQGGRKTWSIYHRSLLGTGRSLAFTLVAGMRPVSVVPNGVGGMWAVTVDEKNAASTGKSTDSVGQLALYSGRHSAGKVFVRTLPSTSELVSHAKGGVFVRVPYSNHPKLTDNASNDEDGALAPGLWFLSVFGHRTRLLPGPMEEDWHLTNDTAHLGVWVVAPSTMGRARSVVHHLTAPAANSEQPQPQELHRDHHKEQPIDVEFDAIQSILDGGGDHAGGDGAGGGGGSVLLHHKAADRWKLSHAKIGRRKPAAFYDCPKSNRICEDGRGGVWLMKKVGKKNERELQHVNDDGKMAKCALADRFEGSSTMAGSS